MSSFFLNSPTGVTLITPTLDDYAVADINRDGKPDLITLADGQIRLFLGNGNGAFQAPITIGQGSSFLRIADVNGDGLMDLVTEGDDLGTGGVSTFLANADGTFQAPVRSSLPTDFTNRIAILQDFTNDGRADLIVINGNGTIGVLVGSESGVFVQEQLILPPLTAKGFPDFATSIAVGDVSFDGIPDLLIGYADGEGVDVLLGDGTGTFQVLTRLSIGFNIRNLALADLDGDGTIDLVADNQASFFDAARVSIFSGNNDGFFAFETLDVSNSLGQGNATSLIAVADVNRDGRPDLLFRTFNFLSDENNVEVLAATGDASYQFLTLFPTTPGLGSTYKAVVTDINGDGNSDIVAGAINLVNSGVIGILLGSDHGTFNDSFSNIPQIAAVAVGDIDGDGFLDIIELNTNDTIGSLQAQFGYSSVTFSQAGTGVAAIGIETPLAIAAADFNNDGLSDCVIADGSMGLATVLLSRGDGTFRPGAMLGMPKESIAVAVAAGDLNGDGTPDFAVANEAGDNIVVYLGTGFGNFVSGFTLELPIDSQPVSVVFKDVNGDRVPDVLVPLRGSKQLVVFLNNGGGVLRLVSQLSLGSDPVAFDTADINNDGTIDLVVASVAGPLLVFFGNGSGGFDAGEQLGGVRDVRSVSILGLDDGADDIIVIGADGTFAYFGNGAGRFFGPSFFFGFFGGGINASAAVMGDINGDGLGDLVLVDQGRSEILELLSFREVFPVPDPVSTAFLTPLQGLQVVPATSPLSLTFVSTTTSVLNVSATSGTAQSASASGTVEEPSRVNTLPVALDFQPQRLELPTERDILASMDLARSLLAGNRPQANLVRQEQDSVVPVGALSASEANDKPKLPALSSTVANGNGFVPLMINPLENTLLGPVAGPNPVIPSLDLSMRDAVDLAFQRWRSWRPSRVLLHWMAGGEASQPESLARLLALSLAIAYSYFPGGSQMKGPGIAFKDKRLAASANKINSGPSLP